LWLARRLQFDAAMRTMLLSAAFILAGCGAPASPTPTPGPTPEATGAPTPTDPAMSGPTGGDAGSGTPTFQPPSDYPPAPADAKIDTTAQGNGTANVPESQVPDQIASLVIADDSGAGGGGGPHPNTPTKAVDATTGKCIAGTELSGDDPADVTCDWAYVCVGPNGTTSRSGTKDLDTKCNPTNAATSFGNNLGNYLQQSCLVYQYWFWCTW
jgi:hypothetical protein